MNRNLLFLALLVFFCVSKLSAQEKEWTLLVYVIGTDIVEDAITDLGEIKAAGNTDNINIVGLYGGAQIAGWETPVPVTFVNGEEIPQSFQPSDNIMVSTSNLTEFIDWGTANYPAQKYMIAFYNHGMATRGFGHENVSDSQFSLDDIKTSLGNSNFYTNGNKFELLGFDACLMACLEAQSVLKDFANYFIASEEEEPWHAWSWTPIITAMNNQAGLNGFQLGQIIIDTYMQHSIDKKTNAVTLSVTDLSKITALEQSIEAVLLSLNDEVFLANFRRARGLSEEYGKAISDPSVSEDVVDIGDLFSNLKELEPSLSDEIDELMAKLNAAVLYERSDASRPKATGMSMYVPYNQFQDDEIIDFFINDNYNLISHSPIIKNFIINDYVPFAASDDSPLPGAIDNSLGFTGNQGGLGMKYSAIKLDAQHANDLDQIQVILLEEITETPEEFIVLGSTHIDTVVTNSDGSKVFGYEWDEDWLAIDGKPVYIADIQDFEIKDENGNLIETFTRLHKPAILHPGTDEKLNVILTYKLDENDNYTLEGIEGEPYLVETTTVPSKERIQLEAGDQVQMIYEVFNPITNEANFIPDEDNILTIENGNDDLNLEHHRLEPGNYHVGFVLMDHAQNDTIIYDPMLRTVSMSNTNKSVFHKDLEVFPNPFKDRINVKEKNQLYTYILTNVLGVEIYRGKEIWKRNFSDLVSGTYYLRVQEKIGEAYKTKVLIKE